jgi:hypothetical protein
MRRKDQSIETLRGLAIILMVSGHVIGVNQTRGLMVDDDSIWRYLFYSTKYIQMELFAAIAGFVYAIKPVNDQKIGKFILAKARRLLLPLVVVSTIQFLYRVAIPYSSNPYILINIWKIYFYTYGHFWFLQVLFLVFLSIFILEYFRLLQDFRTWAIIYLVVTIVFVVWNPLLGISFFSLTRFLFILSYFLLGLGIRRFLHDMQIPRYAIILIGVVFVVFYSSYTIAMITDLPGSIRFFRIIGTLIGISATLLLFRFRRNNKFLAKVGFYSYGIYLLHLFGVRFILEASRFLDLKHHLITFTVAMIVGIGLPILFEMGIMKNNILRLLFLGLKPVKKTKHLPMVKNSIFAEKPGAEEITKYT